MFKGKKKFGILPIIGAGAAEKAVETGTAVEAAPLEPFNHGMVYEEQIKPLMDQVGAIMAGVGMNGFTMFEVALNPNSQFRLEGSNWNNNLEIQSFQRYICLRVASEPVFAERLRSVMSVLDAPDSDILSSLMGLKKDGPAIMGTTH